MSGYALLIDQFNRQADIKRAEALQKQAFLNQMIQQGGGVAGGVVQGAVDQSALNEYVDASQQPGGPDGGSPGGSGGAPGGGAAPSGGGPGKMAVEAPSAASAPAWATQKSGSPMGGGASGTSMPSPASMPAKSGPMATGPTGAGMAMSGVGAPGQLPPMPNRGAPGQLPPMPGALPPPPQPANAAQRPIMGPPTSPPGMPDMNRYKALGRMSPQMASRAGMVMQDQQGMRSNERGMAALSVREQVAAMREAGLDNRAGMLDSREREMKTMAEQGRNQRFDTGIASKERIADSANLLRSMGLENEARALEERARHNVATETETGRSNVARETETGRHNAAGEALGQGNLDARTNEETGRTDRFNQSFKQKEEENQTRKQLGEARLALSQKIAEMRQTGTADTNQRQAASSLLSSSTQLLKQARAVRTRLIVADDEADTSELDAQIKELEKATAEATQLLQTMTEEPAIGGPAEGLADPSEMDDDAIMRELMGGR